MPSAEVLALLAPQVSAQVRATAFGDESLQQLYAQLYKAFANRRSLLLLNLESQVRITELPWVQPLERIRQQAATASKQGAERPREALAQLAAAAFEAFPETILPNKLLKELGQLVQAAQLHPRLALVEEIAVDIFMHAFSNKFLRAAELTARLLANTPYATYYSIDCGALLEIAQAKDQERFYRMCCDRAGFAQNQASRSYATPAVNGTIVEQQQILTSHNLAGLFSELDLATRIGLRLSKLPRKCLHFIVQQLGALHNSEWRTQLQTLKNCAYAWRQMVFFLSLLAADEQQAFYGEATQQVDGIKDEGMRARFQPLLAGIGEALHGTRPHVVFLGWVTSRHPLLPPKK